MNKRILITGGAGFIGSNVANAAASAGQPVLIYDNFSRPGVERNFLWLKQNHPDLVECIQGDIRDAALVRKAVSQSSRVFHFAAQVAVTTSLVSPVDDFETNVRGTLNVLEAIRAQDEPPPLLFTSTNKVYGSLDDIALRQIDDRYEPVDEMQRMFGVSETRPLDFHSPYGCSKGAADQYVLDYARSFGLKTVVFRMSCIYGQRQFGTEDQGWAAHFLIKALSGEPIAIYGDGRQVRDILHVDDLVRAMMLAQKNIETLGGRAFNMGGGPSNRISLIDLLEKIKSLTGIAPRTEHKGWRVGDQRYFVSDTRQFQQAAGWSPAVDVDTGIARLLRWVRESCEPDKAPEAATKRSPALAAR